MKINTNQLPAIFVLMLFTWIADETVNMAYMLVGVVLARFLGLKGSQIHNTPQWYQLLMAFWYVSLAIYLWRGLETTADVYDFKFTILFVLPLFGAVILFSENK